MTASAVGALFLVPNALDLGTPAAETPLDEVLPRAVLREAARLEHWVVENARSARAFLKRVDRIVPLGRPIQAISIVELPRPPKGGAQPPRPGRGPSGRPGTSPTTRGAAGTADTIDGLLSPCREGQDVGLLSEAGLPAVADPGSALVEAAHRAGVRVVALPGPSSLLLALAASGLNGQSFAFVGYLPVEASERGARIRELEAWSARQRQTQLAIETPYRNGALLGALLDSLQPSTRLAVACGLTLPGSVTRSDDVRGWRARPVALPDDVPAVFGWLAPR